MTSDERAARLRLVQQDAEDDATYREELAIAAARKHGDWRWRPVGPELQIRTRANPTLQLDLTRTEAHSLMLALSMALSEKPPNAARPSPWWRFMDWLARSTWRRSHAAEAKLAMIERAKEFRDGGGWG